MRRENLKFLFVLIFALILRLINLNQSFWLDEAAQVIESSRTFWQQFDLAADFHPPLYHTLLHFWLYLGRSEIWVRLLSVALALFSIWLIYQLGKVIADKKRAFLSASFLAISPYHLWYSQETRPYMAFLAFSLLSTFLLIRKSWFWYTLALILSLYTHYFTLFLLVGHVIYIFASEKKDIRIFLASIAVSIAAFAVWLPKLLGQLILGTHGLFQGWTDVVSISAAKTSALTFAKFIFGRGSIENNYLYAAVVLPVFLLFIFALIATWKEKSGKISGILFFAPFLSSEVISLFIPINAPQRLIFLLPLFYLILACGIYKLRPNLKMLAVLIVVLISLGGIYQYYTDPNVQRENWRDAVVFTEQENNSQSAALFVFPGPFAPYTWYAKGKIDAWGIAPKFILTDDDLRVLTDRLQTKKKIYLYQYLTGLTDLKQQTRNYLETQGFRQTDIRNFPGVGFIYVYDRE